MNINLAKIDFCPGSGTSRLQDNKSAEMLLTETSKEVTPDSGYDGMKKVTVTHAPVESNTNTTITTNGSHVITPSEGYDATLQVTANINVPEQKPEETLTQTITANGTTTYNPTEGSVFDSATITVSVLPTLQSKTVSTYSAVTTLTPDSGYDGLSSATVDATGYGIDQKTLGVAEGIAYQKARLESISITANGTYTKEDGYNNVSVNVPEQKPEETLTQTITANGTTTYSPTEGSVFDSATITVSVPTPSGTKFITENGVHNVTNYADANVSVTVEEVVPNDEIWYTTPDGTTLGFTDLTALGASYGGPTIISNTYSSGKGIIKFAEPVTWIGFKLEGSSLIYGPQWLCAPQVGIPVNKLESVYLPNSVTEILGYNHPQFSYIGAFDNCKNLIKVVMGDSISTIGAGTFTSEHETAPTFDLFIRTTTPPALGDQADAFISNATVYSPSGTTSTYQSAWSEYGPTAASAYKVDDHLYIQNKTANPSTSTQTITPDSQYVGLNSVIVNPVTSSIDANIIADNIKKDVAILGVTGTFEGGVTPTGTISISSNGTYDVTNYASASVAVGGTDYRYKTGTVDTAGLTELGWTADEIGYLNANVNPHYSWQNDEYTVSQDNKDLVGTITSANYMNYANDSRLEYMPITVAPGWGNFRNMKYLKGIRGTNATAAGSSCQQCFEGCSSLETIPPFNTSSTTDMNNMFLSCSELKTIPLLDTSNATNMNAMFAQCSSLTSIPLLDTGNVTNMSGMFDGCSLLTTIPLLDTSSVTSMDYMFIQCTSLTTIPQLDTSNVTDMLQMFQNCTSLTTIPQLDTSNVTSMFKMFEGCTNLTSVPQLDVSKVTDMRSMFDGCKKLSGIINFANSSRCTNFYGMFYDGWNGTVNISEIYLDMSSATTSYLFGGSSTSWARINKFILTAGSKLNVSIGGLNMLTSIDYDSIKSILTAMSNTDTTSARTMTFNRTITDQGGELAALVATCTTKGWTISGLTIN